MQELEVLAEQELELMEVLALEATEAVLDMAQLVLMAELDLQEPTEEHMVDQTTLPLVDMLVVDTNSNTPASTPPTQ